MRRSREELLNSPSRRDGIDVATEQQTRKTYFNFIKKMVQDLKLRAWTVETATIFAHRFFAVRSLAKNDRFLVAASSVFLACKVDESPRALRDVAYVYYSTRNSKKPAEIEKLRTNPDAVLKELMEQLLLAERAIMYTLAFDLNVDHPYTHLATDVIRLGIEKLGKDFFQQSVNILNDSLATTLCLQYEAATLAHAVMFEVARRSSFNLPIPDSRSFQDYFSITQAELDEIIPQVLALYDKKPKAAPAQASAGDCAPGTPQIPPPQAKAGPPLPSFRPIIIPSDGQPVRPAPSSRQRAADAEEGELPSSTPKPSLAVPAPASASGAQQSGAAAVQQNGAASESAAVGKSSAAAAVAAADSDGEDAVRHAPSSADQNNHNEPDAVADGRPAVQECEQQQATRKRTRSPGALEEGEIGFVRCSKSPCYSPVPT